ncbi:ATP-binding cassette domain-containing protein [Micrococcus luteus]|uniref:ATP-binding cassette domain-containing protein n=1 Tax=Micrococcus luteus TaxID=1270 RepID=UPI0036B56A41
MVQDIRRCEDGSSNTRHSGGERQCLAIMSALTRGADLLLMDEPTSQLDGVAERNVVDLVRERPSGTTAVVITHRLTTVRDADQILLTDRGRIADRGTHEDLWTRCAAYRALWEEPTPQTASLTAA